MDDDFCYIRRNPCKPLFNPVVSGCLWRGARDYLTTDFGSGLNGLLNNVTDWKPFEETRYRARFYFDPNTITMSNGNAHYLLYALNRSNVMVARVEFDCKSCLYQAADVGPAAQPTN